MSLARTTLAVLALAAATLAGCDRGDSTAEAALPRLQGGMGIPAFALSDARLEVAHTGLRRITLAQSGVTYRERLTTDGLGRFAIEAVDSPDGSVEDWDLFALLHNGREGFHFRYRDFFVRDRVRFAQQWICTELTPGSVAGRQCQRYRIEQRAGPASFELSVDRINGLVLASVERDDGQLVSSMTYETFESGLGNERSAIEWHVPSNEEELLDPAEDLVTQLDRPALEPRLLPQGYALLEAATVADGTGERWLKLTYTDGVYPLFFMQNLTPREPDRVLARPGQTAAAERIGPSTVTLFQMGSALVAQGDVQGYELIAIGRASEDELLDLLESSLP